MLAKYVVAEIGALVADPSRVEMLTRLLDGERHSAGDLARAAGVSPQAASAHLTKLTRGGLVRVTRAGRSRLFEIDRPEVGELLESLSAATRPRQTMWMAPCAEPIRLARTCYDHMAGQLAVLITRAWLERGILRARGTSFELTAAGGRWFAARGIDSDALRRQRRAFVRGCLDWTEREPHLGGSLGAAWLQHCFGAGWIKRISRTRAVRLSDTGRAALRDLLGIDAPSLARSA